MRTILIVVDTLRYDEAFRWTSLLKFPHRWYSNAWAVAPFTLPAMASMVSGLLPEKHRLWADWRDPVRCRMVSRVKSTVAHDFGMDAVAVAGAGFANGGQFGYANGFREWRKVPAEVHFPDWADEYQGVRFLLLHSFELHNYIGVPCPTRAEGTVFPYIDHDHAEPVHPMEQLEARREKLGWVEDRLRVLVRNNPADRILVTSDHGEGFSPGCSLGHGAGHLPTEEVLHVPLVEFGPEQKGATVDPRFVPQHRLRGLLAGELDTSPVRVRWPWDRDGRRKRTVSFVLGWPRATIKDARW